MHIYVTNLKAKYVSVTTKGLLWCKRKAERNMGLDFLKNVIDPFIKLNGLTFVEALSIALKSNREVMIMA